MVFAAFRVTSDAKDPAMLTLSEGHCEGKSGAMVSIVEDMENPLMDLKKEVICVELM